MALTWNRVQGVVLAALVIAGAAACARPRSAASLLMYKLPYNRPEKMDAGKMDACIQVVPVHPPTEPAHP